MEKMKFHPWVLSLAPCVYGTALAQDGAPFYGPLEVRNLRLLQMPFYRFPMRGASLETGEQSWSFRWDESNDIRVFDNRFGEEILREDAETTRFTSTYRKGLSHGCELSVEIPINLRWGGFMDNIIDWWHDHVLSSPHPLRDGKPIDESIIRFPGADYEGHAFGLGDLSVNLSKTFGHRFRLESAIKLPTGNVGQFLGSGSPDFGLALDYTASINGHWTAFFQGGVIAQGRSTIPGTRGLAHQENIAVAWHPNRRDAWIAQWNSESAAIQTGIAPSDATHRMLSFGYQRALSPRTRLDLYFSEDKDLLSNDVPDVASVAPDFSVGAMLKVKF